MVVASDPDKGRVEEALSWVMEKGEESLGVGDILVDVGVGGSKLQKKLTLETNQFICKFLGFVTKVLLALILMTNMAYLSLNLVTNRLFSCSRSQIWGGWVKGGDEGEIEDDGWVRESPFCSGLAL